MPLSGEYFPTLVRKMKEGLTVGVNRCNEFVRRELLQGSLICSPQSAMLMLLCEQQEGC